MRQERALKVVLVVVGLIFYGLVYPLMIFVKQEPALAMMLSVYVTLGIFLLLAALTSGTMMIVYAGVCASLIRLRMLRPKVDAPLAHAASESGRLQNSIRSRNGCCGCCNCPCADDRTQEP